MLKFLWPQALWKKIAAVAILVSGVSAGVMQLTGEEEEKGPVDLYQIEQLQKEFGTGEMKFAQARLGSLPLTVKGSGHIHLPRRTQLYFEATRASTESFTVKEIYVVEGQVVKKDQALAKLDTTTLERLRERAKIQVDYAEVNKKAKENDVERAEKKLEKAEKEYKARLLDKASKMRDSAFGATQAAEKLFNSTLNPALSDPFLLKEYRTWKNNPQGQMVIPLPPESGLETPPKDLRETIDRVSWLVNYIGSFQQILNGVFNAVDNMRHAMEEYQEYREMNEEGEPESPEIKQARQELENAQLQVENAQLQVENAQLALIDAEDKLAGAVIKAPFDGVVEDIIDIEEGERISGTVPIISLIDPSEVEININVGEMDIDKIKMDQPVKVSLDAFPFMKLDGRVKNVPLASETVSGVVTYEVVAQVDPPPRFIMQLREGSSALAEITIGIQENVVWVPNMAVRGGKVYVVKGDNLVQEQAVFTGRIEGDYTQIISDLKGGETLAML
jgi:RND family efflux transporter MFP subunit